MKRHSVLAVVVLVAMVSANAPAQSAPKPAAEVPTGFTAYAEFGGTANGDGQIYQLTTTLGYDFTSHLGVDAGVPVYFVRPSSSTGAVSTNGLGNPFVDVHARYALPIVNFGTVLTGFVPVGDSNKGLSTGRGTFDWTNHFDHSFSKLTPFVNVGIANTIVNTSLFVRPYTTLGFNTHFEGGATYDMWRFLRVGASAYDIVPTGRQTIFSQVAHGAAGQHGRIFESAQQTTGSADIAKDDGFSAWIGANPWRGVNLLLGFTRSMHYELNSVSFGVGFNLKQMYGAHAQ